MGEKKQINISTITKRGFDDLKDGVLMGLGILVISYLARKVDHRVVPSSTKLGKEKLIGAAVVSTFVIDGLIYNEILPATYGHVKYRTGL